MPVPSNRTSPTFGGTKPEITPNSVVLPAPFGPMMPTISPFATEKLIEFSATTPPKRFVTPSISRKAIDWPQARARGAV